MISVSLPVVPLRTSARIGSPAATVAAVALTGSFGFAPASGTAASTSSVVPAAITLALAMMPPQETTRISRDALVRRRLYAVNSREILIGPLRLLEALLGQITQVDGALGALLRQDAASSSEREDLGAS